MSDDGKRTETLCTKVTERMALDMLRLAALEDRSPSDFMFLLLRRKLYGDIVKLNVDAEQFQK